MRHRPIGIGVQGLADVYMMLKIPFESEKAKQLNKEIFETIYFGACTARANSPNPKDPTKHTRDHLPAPGNLAI